MGQENQMMSNEITVAIIGGMFTVLVTSVGWCFRILLLIRTDAKDINDAVNHRHRHAGEDGSLPPRLFDLVIENHDIAKEIRPKVDDLHEWKKGYDGSGLSNAERVNELISRVDHVEGQLSSMSIDDERSIARNKFFQGLDEPNSHSDTEEEIG